VNSTVKTVVFWLVIVLSAFLLWQVVKAGSAGQKEQEFSFSQFMGEVEKDNVKEVTIIGQEVRGKLLNPPGSAFHTTAPANYPDMIKMLREKGVNITIRDVSWPSWLLYLAPLILQAEIVGLGLWFFMRPLASRGARSFST
jgi:cell division protease FtsH